RRQRSWVVYARAGMAEEVVELAGEEQHRDDQQDRDRGDDERVLGDRLTLFAVAKGGNRRLRPDKRAQQDVRHVEPPDLRLPTGVFVTARTRRASSKCRRRARRPLLDGGTGWPRTKGQE